MEGDSYPRGVLFWILTNLNINNDKSMYECLGEVRLVSLFLFVN
jgi:hypothetical protein